MRKSKSLLGRLLEGLFVGFGIALGFLVIPGLVSSVVMTSITYVFGG